jgi:hypothetical protein
MSGLQEYFRKILSWTMFPSKGESQMQREGGTIRLIREAVRNGTLKEPFKPADVNRVLNVSFAGNFLPKHRVGNPGIKGKKNTELFVKIDPGLYRLN